MQEIERGECCGQQPPLCLHYMSESLYDFILRRENNSLSNSFGALSCAARLSMRCCSTLSLPLILSLLLYECTNLSSLPADRWSGGSDQKDVGLLSNAVLMAPCMVEGRGMLHVIEILLTLQNII